ncbi:MAG: acetylxylan esterase [bacterium]
MRKNHANLLLILALAACLMPAIVCAADIPVETLYAYDKHLPMNLKVEKADETAEYVKYHISFRSTHERTVTALLVLPKNAQPPYPVLMLQHGLNASKDEIFERYGGGLIKAGYAIFLMDGELHGERRADVSDAIIRYPIVLRDVFIQTIIDLRRAVDYLKTRNDLDTARLAYIGFSLGSYEGTVFTSIDKRIKAVILVVCGSLEPTFAPLRMLPEYRELSVILDPERYIKKIAPRPLLMVNANQDAVIPLEGARKLFEAAEQPKEQIFVDDGHVIAGETLVPIIVKWLDEIKK